MPICKNKKIIFELRQYTNTEQSLKYFFGKITLQPDPLLRLALQQRDDGGDVCHEISVRDDRPRHPEHVVRHRLHEAPEHGVVVVEGVRLRAIWPVQGVAVLVGYMT